MSDAGVGYCEGCEEMVGSDNPFEWAYLHSLETGHWVRTLIGDQASPT